MKTGYFTIFLHLLCLIPIALLAPFHVPFWGLAVLAIACFIKAATTNPGFVVNQVTTESALSSSVIINSEAKLRAGNGSKTSGGVEETPVDPSSSSSRSRSSERTEEVIVVDEAGSNTTSSGSEEVFDEDGVGDVNESEIDESSNEPETSRNEEAIIVETRYCTVC
jgi:hypothetical protein